MYECKGNIFSKWNYKSTIYTKEQKKKSDTYVDLEELLCATRFLEEMLFTLLTSANGLLPTVVFALKKKKGS